MLKALVTKEQIQTITYTNFRLNLNTSHIESFYRRDDISRQAPGMKDMVITKVNGVKTKTPKRHLYYKVQTIHAMYCEENDISVSFSKFASLRPVDVQLLRDIPLDVCLCETHENFIAIIDCLFPNDPYNRTWIENHAICTSATEQCYLSTCSNCSSRDNIHNMLQSVENRSDFKINLWEKREKRIEKCKMTYSFQEISTILIERLPHFLRHHFIKRQQENSFNKDKTSACSEKFIIQCDFSENYTCFYQNEIQSAHWHQSQITVFTVCIWDQTGIHSYAILSDNLVHDKLTAVSYLCAALDDKIAGCSNVSEFSIWSDGPSSQFKNR